MTTQINGADTAWMLVSTALVLLMTPALGFFYGGLVRSKNALNTIMMSVIALGVVGVVWALLAYSLAFAPGGQWLGDTSFALLKGVDLNPSGPASALTIPHMLFMAFQAAFAIIAAALVSGAIVERMRFPAYMAFLAVWSLLIYAPVAHWVWGGGFLGKMGALDFAGGTVIHITAGFSALVVAIVLGARKDYGHVAHIPHNVPFVLLGSGLLWFGWFGFNGGSALAANGIAALAFTNTLLAPAATVVVWAGIDLFRSAKVTGVGTATAIVVGLVGITPAAGFVSPLSALILGALVAFPTYMMILWRSNARLDDSLDVFAAHGITGVSGALLTGVLAEKKWNGLADGLLFGNPGQLGTQFVAVGAAIGMSLIGTIVCLVLVSVLFPLRVTEDEESLGLDISEHGEESYATGEGAVVLLAQDVPAAKLKISKSTQAAKQAGKLTKAGKATKDAKSAKGSKKVAKAKKLPEKTKQAIETKAGSAAKGTKSDKAVNPKNAATKAGKA